MFLAKKNKKKFFFSYTAVFFTMFFLKSVPHQKGASPIHALQVQYANVCG